MLAKKRSMSDASQGYCAQESPYKNQANLADWQRVSLGYYSARMGRASASKARVENSDPICAGPTATNTNLHPENLSAA